MVMVGKLIKHELYSTARIAAIPAAVMILLAILARIMLATSSVDVAFVIILFYVFAVMATIAIGYIFGLSSFYQSLFTSNGYLTLSLPVTADQLIWSKLISAITVMFASLVVCLLSACIFFIGLDKEILEAIREDISMFGNIFIGFASEEPLYFVELVLEIIIGIPASFLFFYAIMSIGQLFTKHRRVIAIGLYIGIMFIFSIFQTTVLDELTFKMTEVSIHLTMWISIVVTAAIDVGCYFLVRFIIKNKVNLLA